MGDERARRKPSGALELDLTLAPEARAADPTRPDARTSTDLALEASDGAPLDDVGPERAASRVELPAPRPAPGSFLALTDETLVLDDHRAPEPVRAEPEAPPAPAERALTRRRWARALVVITLFALLALAALASTPIGDGVLPESLRAPVRAATRRVTDELPKLGGDTLYTFTDDQGVIHIVDALEKVPEKYRARAKLQR